MNRNVVEAYSVGPKENDCVTIGETKIRWKNVYLQKAIISAVACLLLF